MSKQTYWNGEKCKARRVTIIVGKPPISTWWFADLVGTERQAVEVTYGKGDAFLIDNEDGSGWKKVTSGRGGPHLMHKSLVGTVLEATHD